MSLLSQRVRLPLPEVSLSSESRDPFSIAHLRSSRMTPGPIVLDRFWDPAWNRTILEDKNVFSSATSARREAMPSVAFDQQRSQ